MNRKFTIGRRASQEENIPNNYEIIDIDAYKPSKPIVLVLGGNGTTEDRLANGNAKIVSSMLGVFNEDVDLLSVNYNQALGEPYMTNNCLELVQKLFLPYVSKKGKRIDIKTACKNMRNLTVFAHCRGVDGAMKRIMIALKLELENLKYSQQEQQQIISQIVLIGYGSSFKHDIEGVKGIYCLSFTDKMFSNDTKHLANQFLSKMDMINMVKYDKELFKSIDTSKNIDYIWNNVTEILYTHRRVYNIKEEDKLRLFAFGLYQTDNHLWQDDHSVKNLAREEDWSSNKNASSTGDCVSRCLACALCNSVANSIMNNKTRKFIELDMQALQTQLDEICKKHNYEQSKVDDRVVEDEFEQNLTL